MHQGEATTSQLGWHPDELPSYTANLKFYLKKGGKYKREDQTKTLEKERKKTENQQKQTKDKKSQNNNHLRKSKPR